MEERSEGMGPEVPLGPEDALSRLGKGGSGLDGIIKNSTKEIAREERELSEIEKAHEREMQEAREEAEAMELVKRLLAERVGPFHERYQDEQKAQLVGEYLINEMKLRKQEELERQIHQLMKMVNPRFRGIDGLFDLLRDAL